jgi:hypothetical protein
LIGDSKRAKSLYVIACTVGLKVSAVPWNTKKMVSQQLAATDWTTVNFETADLKTADLGREAGNCLTPIARNTAEPNY